MSASHNAVAVLFPGADNKDVIKASEQYHIQVVNQEEYSTVKDYERYFKPSRRIFHKDDVNLLFVFADGSAQLADDMMSMKNVMNKIKSLISKLS
ncbi:MAG: hypothetical protein JST82_01550 [Bacteroidetes bacterium]|nr:hypothetical protein [Bacteroidota bacterium]